jgi:hypothetical protein
MVRISRSLLALALALAATPALAQSPAQLKTELKTKEAAAKKDPDALFEVGKWAADKALAADSKRIFQAVLKIKPDHAAANEALGNALVEGKWIPAKEAEALRKKAQAAEYAAKGMVDVGGVWVEKDKVEDAKRGVFHHDGQLVTKAELLALQGGKVRHPDTGELIDPKHLEKAQNKYYPVGSEGRWVDLKEADTYHSEPKRPWVVRSQHGTIVTTLGLAKIEELQRELDVAIEKVATLFGGRMLPPTLRPVVLVAATETEYRDHGANLSDGPDAAGAFMAPAEAKLPIRDVGEMSFAVCNNHKDWGIRYLRHAAALAYANGLAVESGNALPLWLCEGIGSYTSRFQNDSDAGWFGKQHMAKGGVRNLKSFFQTFAINGDMESKDVDYNLFQSGLCVSFAAHGGDAKVTEALQGLAAALTSGAKGSGAKAVSKLEAELIAAEPKLAAYLQQLIAKAPQ